MNGCEKPANIDWGLHHALSCSFAAAGIAGDASCAGDHHGCPWIPQDHQHRQSDGHAWRVCEDGNGDKKAIYGAGLPAMKRDRPSGLGDCHPRIMVRRLRSRPATEKTATATEETATATRKTATATKETPTATKETPTATEVPPSAISGTLTGTSHSPTATNRAPGARAGYAEFPDQYEAKARWISDRRRERYRGNCRRPSRSRCCPNGCRRGSLIEIET